MNGDDELLLFAIALLFSATMFLMVVVTNLQVVGHYSESQGLWMLLRLLHLNPCNCYHNWLIIEPWK